MRRALATLALSLTITGEAAAHGALKSSVPSSRAVLSRPPAELRLTFNERPELRLARIALLGPDSQRVSLGPVMQVDSGGLTLVTRVLGPMEAGTQTVSWEVTGADGHPVRGTFTFVVASADSVRRELDTTAHHDTLMMPQSAAGFDAESPGYVVVRFAFYLALLVVVGAVVFRHGVLRFVARRGDLDPALVPDAARRAATAGVAAAGLLIAACVARLVAQMIALDTNRIADILAGTSWGRWWVAQLALAVAALVGFTIVRRRGAVTGSGAGWMLATVGALGVAFTPAWTSHAAAVQRLRPIAIMADGLHVIGAAGWLGALFVILVAGIPAALALGSERRTAAVAALINAFSPTALAFAALVAVSGVFAAWLHVGGLGQLWSSTYGRLLVAKVVAVLLVALVGAYNMWRLKPALGAGEGASRIRRSATTEIALGVVVVFLTAILVATPPAMESMQP